MGRKKMEGAEIDITYAFIKPPSVKNITVDRINEKDHARKSRGRQRRNNSNFLR
jgi:hypothetical protein